MVQFSNRVFGSDVAEQWLPQVRFAASLAILSSSESSRWSLYSIPFHCLLILAVFSCNMKSNPSLPLNPQSTAKAFHGRNIHVDVLCCPSIGMPLVFVCTIWADIPLIPTRIRPHCTLATASSSGWVSCWLGCLPFHHIDHSGRDAFWLPHLNCLLFLSHWLEFLANRCTHCTLATVGLSNQVSTWSGCLPTTPCSNSSLAGRCTHDLAIIVYIKRES